MRRASTTPKLVKIASPAGTPIIGEWQEPRIGRRVDQKCVAEPIEPGHEVAEAEPPADHRRRSDMAREAVAKREGRGGIVATPAFA